MLDKKIVNENEFSFVCNAKNTRSGFAHTCELYRGTSFVQKSQCNYLNRTWESYTYQSVMKQTVHCKMEEVKFELVDNYKRENNVKRIKQETKELIYSQSEELKLYNNLLNTL